MILNPDDLMTIFEYTVYDRDKNNVCFEEGTMYYDDHELGETFEWDSVDVINDDYMLCLAYVETCAILCDLCGGQLYEDEHRDFDPLFNNMKLLGYDNK